MNYLSLFSGIEAASVAWQPLSWRAVAFADIEPFPCAVLAHHYPDVPNLGDVTKITDEQIAALGQIDVVVGGSPCQDLSVAGGRKGLSGARSCLFHEQIRIFHATRKYCGARFLIWENVPGAFSSHKGADFACVVGAMAGCSVDVPADGWGQEGVALGEHGLLEWAVLDAQWFDLAQRRRRIFAVLDTGDWRDRAPILLERDSLRGDCPTREQTQQTATRAVFDSATGNSPYASDVAMCLNAGGMGRQDAESETFILTKLGRPDGRSLAYHNNDTTDAPIMPSAREELIAHQQCVRRLTPRECERLQGFPDDYTAIPWRGKPAEQCPDRPRYRALGNSMAVPVMRWIGQRIDAVNNKNPCYGAQPQSGRAGNQERQ